MFRNVINVFSEERVHRTGMYLQKLTHENTGTNKNTHMHEDEMDAKQ